jgi:hypothetical protein
MVSEIREGETQIRRGESPVKTQEDIGVMQSQAKECLELSETIGKSSKDSPTRPFRDSAGLGML